MSPHRILILGGTTEARRMAERLAQRTDLDITVSLAGRTVNPVAYPVPVRSGGFGGAVGLADHLRSERIALLVDATHPFAAAISRNAAEAARLAQVPLIALRRPAWKPVEGDRWTMVQTAEEAVEALGAARRRVFVALGRQELEPLIRGPQHHYVIRSVDPVEPPLPLPDAHYIVARAPFPEIEERALLAARRIDAIIAKNSGGDATYGKIAAARALGIPVILLQCPRLPEAPAAGTVEAAVAMLDHWLAAAEKRGV